MLFSCADKKLSTELGQLWSSDRVELSSRSTREIRLFTGLPFDRWTQDTWEAKWITCGWHSAKAPAFQGTKLGQIALSLSTIRIPSIHSLDFIHVQTTLCGSSTIHHQAGAL